MRVKSVVFLVLILLAVRGNAQLLLMNFNVDSTTTVIGPSPTSISGSAGTLAGGSVGKGLSAKYQSSDPKVDIDMDFANTSNIWDVSGIEVSIDFQREESTGWFFTRLSNDFRLGMAGGNLQVRYEVDDGLGGSTTINSGSIQSIPNDDVFRRYRFSYNPADGVGTVYVDGTSVWTNDGTDSRSLYWTGAGNLRIGDGMDGTGRVEAIFDSVLVNSYSGILLPLELIRFEMLSDDQQKFLEWTTASEINLDIFEVEQSLDANHWNLLGHVEASGNSNTERVYRFRVNPESSLISYYRIKAIDFDGSYEYSKTVFHQPLEGPEASNLRVAYLNDQIVIESPNGSISTIQKFDLRGNLLWMMDVNRSLVHVPRKGPGILTLSLENGVVETLKVN